MSCVALQTPSLQVLRKPKHAYVTNDTKNYQLVIKETTSDMAALMFTNIIYTPVATSSQVDDAYDTFLNEAQSYANPDPLAASLLQALEVARRP